MAELFVKKHENRTGEKKASESASAGGASIVLSPAEAEEYCVFKRQKRVEEVLVSLKKTVLAPEKDLSFGEIKKCAETARASRSIAVRVPPNKVAFTRNALAGSGVLTDCLVGGNGETTAQVKRYETKRAVRDGAGRITLILSSAAVKAGRFGEVKKDVKKVCRAAKKRPVTVALYNDFSKTAGVAEWKKLAAISADCGAKYISVPFYRGAAELRAYLKDTCMMEVTGVNNSADFKSLVASGVECLGVSGLENIRAELLYEAENCSFTVPASQSSFFSAAPVAPNAPVMPAAPVGSAPVAAPSEGAAEMKAEATDTPMRTVREPLKG